MTLVRSTGRGLAGQVVLLVVIAACTGAGPVPSASSGQSAPQTDDSAAASLPPASAEATANPTADALSVQVSLDTDQTVSEIVLPEVGATLEATGSDGTTFTLTIPPDALVFAEEITMTPIEQIEGVPFAGGLVGEPLTCNPTVSS
ncbi:MAG: hypothetical protein ACR2H0_07220 [Candidatus Limnocylindrales bacterium]